MYLTIGSGDTSKLLSGKKTKGFADLLQKFVSKDKPYYNAFASPIDALRTGALLERVYIQTLSDDYYSQYKATSKEFNCLTSSLDFAKLENGAIVDFDEMKTIYFTDFINIVKPLKKLTFKDQIDFLKKKFKNNYNQIQFQLLCSGLKSCNLVFVSVESYVDEENKTRKIEEKDIVRFRIKRDNEIISKIKERAVFFQSIKDFVQK